MTSGAISRPFGNQPLPSVAIEQETWLRHELPAEVSATPGKGALQGMMVGVGPGHSRKALQEDAIGWQDGAWHGGDAADEDIFFDPDEIGDEQFDRLVLTASLQGRPQPPAPAQTGEALADMPLEALPDILPLEAFLGGAGEEALVQPGVREDRDHDQASLEPQQSAAWNFLGGAVSVASALYGRVASTGAGAVNLVQRALEPKPSMTARAENLAAIQSLIQRIDEKQQRLNQQVYGMTSEDTVSTPGSLSVVTPTLGDHLSTARHTATGAVAATASTLPGVTAALAVPLVAGGMVPSFGLVGGMYLALSSLLRLPDKANGEAVMRIIDAGLQEIKPLQEELKLRLAEESARNAADTQVRLAASPRSQQIDAVQMQLKQVESALRDQLAPAPAQAAEKTQAAESAEAAAREPQRVTLGDGGQRRQLQQESLGLRTSFFQFFSRIIDFLFARRNAANEEQAYVQSLHKSFNALASSAQFSRVDALEAAAQRRRAQKGEGKVQPGALRRHLVQGENLARTLLAAKAPNFGVVAYDGGAAHGQYAIAATLTTARMLAHYFDALADLPRADGDPHPHEPQVLRHPDGSLTVADPGRKLHSFLMSAPTAYSPWVRAQDLGALSSAMVIDDHSPGMPGGMSGMRIEAGLDEDGTGDVLRLSFVPRSSDQVFKPLANDMDTLLRLRQALAAPGPATGPSPQQLAQMAPDALRELHAQLTQQLVQLITLREADFAQRNALEHWRNPGFEVDRARIRG